MADINNNVKRGLMRDNTNTSEFNQLDFVLDQKLQNDLNTTWIGRVDACKTEGAGASMTIDVTPLTAQSTAEGDILPMASIPELPHTRLQHGIAAIVINPAQDDIVVMASCKNDITTIKQGTAEPVPAGSYRKFSQSDSVQIGSIHTQAPTVYIELKQDNTIYVKAPAGYKLETDANVDIIAGGDINIKASGSVNIEAGAGLNVKGVQTNSSTITAQGEIKGNGVSMSTHTHSGVRSGSENTGAPNR